MTCFNVGAIVDAKIENMEQFTLVFSPFDTAVELHNDTLTLTIVDRSFGKKSW